MVDTADDQVTTTSESTPAHHAEHEAVAHDVQKEVVKEHKVHNTAKKSTFPFDQIIWYVTGVVQVLLAIRFIFKMLGANTVGFVEFAYSITDPLAVPFIGIFNVSTSGKYIIEWSTIIAMIVYFLIAHGIVKLLKILILQEGK
jgi:hypothetical protein